MAVALTVVTMAVDFQGLIRVVIRIAIREIRVDGVIRAIIGNTCIAVVIERGTRPIDPTDGEYATRVNDPRECSLIANGN